MAEVTSLVDQLVGRFQQGLGAYVPYTDSFGKRGTIYLVPGHILGPEVRGLLIAIDGKAAMLWDGANPLNEFKLVTFGVKPLEVAKNTADLINAVMHRISTPTQKYLAAKKD